MLAPRLIKRSHELALLPYILHLSTSTAILPVADAMAVPLPLRRVLPERLTPMLILNVFFAFLAVVGQVGQNVSLPLWSGSTQLDCGQSAANGTANGSSNGTTTTSESMDPYFVLSTASLSFVVIFGIISLVLVCVRLLLGAFRKDHLLPDVLVISKEDLRFPQWQLLLIGLFDALNGVMVVYASLPDRTAPFLQAILGNFLIPLTIACR